MILPDIFNFISSLGGADYKGWVIFLFTLSAAFSRPFSGRISDRLGRVPVILFGSLVSAVACLLYIFTKDIASLIPFLTAVYIFFFIRVFHGLSTGFKPTGTAAMLADVVPEDRRGEALGWFGFAGSLGMGIGPALGSFIFLDYGYSVLFSSASFIAFLSAFCIMAIPESLPKSERQAISWDLIKIKWKDFYESRVLHPSLVFFLYAYSFGAVYTLMSDKQESLGIDNKGLFFTVYILITAFVRIVSGRLSDKVGRKEVVAVGVFVLIIALYLMSITDNLTLLIASAVAYGIAHGTTTPALIAWVTDLSKEKHRGRAFSTMYIAMELGIGIGAIISAWIYDNQQENFRAAFLMSLFVSLFAFALLLSKWKKQPK